MILGFIEAGVGIYAFCDVKDWEKKLCIAVLLI